MIGVFHRARGLQQDAGEGRYQGDDQYKTEGNPFEPLGKAGRAAMQAQVDEYYGLFIRAVAVGRGVRPSDVENGFDEGRTVTAQAAIAMNMADRIGAMQDTLAQWGVRGARAPQSSSSRAAQAHTPRLNLVMRKQALLESE